MRLESSDIWTLTSGFPISTIKKNYILDLKVSVLSQLDISGLSEFQSVEFVLHKSKRRLYINTEALVPSVNGVTDTPTLAF